MIDFKKANGLIPVIIQDYRTMQVLMLAYMNEEAYERTKQESRVSFYSRTKKRLWTKGESSGNFLEVKEMHLDCDKDTLLIKALPHGPSCHKGTKTCFNESTNKGFLYELETIMEERIKSEKSNSYTNSLYKSGPKKIAQKLGEEAVELALEACEEDVQNLINESADLMYHFLLLLRSRDLSLETVERKLKERSIEIKPEN